MGARVQKRIAQVREKVDISRLLSDMGYPIRASAETEQQFPCDLHGDGADSSPSARVYPDSQSWYCFGCSQSRDVISTVMEKKGLNFLNALTWLEKQYQLDIVPWEAESREDFQADLSASLDQSRTFEDDSRSLSRFLKGITTDRELGWRAVAAFWEVYDKISYLHRKELLPESKTRHGIARLRERIIQAIENLQ